MIKTREFQVFSLHCAAGFEDAAIHALAPFLKAADFSEVAAGTSLNAFIEVTPKSQQRIDFIAHGLGEYCAAQALGFGESRGQLVAVYSLGRVLSRPTGEAVTLAVEAARDSA